MVVKEPNQLPDVFAAPAIPSLRDSSARTVALPNSRLAAAVFASSNLAPASFMFSSQTELRVSRFLSVTLDMSLSASLFSPSSTQSMKPLTDNPTPLTLVKYCLPCSMKAFRPSFLIFSGISSGYGVSPLLTLPNVLRVVTYTKYTGANTFSYQV